MSSKSELIAKLERLAAPGSGATDGERRNALEAIARLKGVSADSVKIEDEPTVFDDIESRYGTDFEHMTAEQLDEIASTINEGLRKLAKATEGLVDEFNRLAGTLSQVWENIPIEIRDYAERCYEAEQSTEMALPVR